VSQHLCEKPKQRCEMLSAAVLNDPSEMVRQMALPFIPDRRVKGALLIVARDSGLTYSKTYRLFYGAARDVWRKEHKKLVDAFKRFTIEQERLYREQAERCAALRAECEALEGQHEFALQARRRAVAEADRILARDLADAAEVEGDGRALARAAQASR
jgi:hypothetical protein